MRADFGDKLIDKLFDLLGQLWEEKRSKKHKKKTLKQFWKDYRKEVKQKQAEYKALPWKTKAKMELKKFGIFNLKWDEPLEVFPTRQKAVEALYEAFDHRSRDCKCMTCIQSGIHEPEACVILPVA